MDFRTDTEINTGNCKFIGYSSRSSQVIAIIVGAIGFILDYIPTRVAALIVSCLLNPCILCIDSVILDPLKTLDDSMMRTTRNKY